MNLLTAPWIPVLLPTGERVKLRLQDIPEAQALAIAHPRADFSALILELVIDLFQTVASPANELKVDELFEGLPPSFEKARVAWESAFELFGENPFMQMPPANPERGPAGSLLYEAPGDQTLKLRKDFFVKFADSLTLCPHCAPVALYLNQAHARAGGNGYFTGPRTGSALTALVQGASLWETICLNLLPESWFDQNIGQATAGVTPNLLPWRNQGGLMTEGEVRPATDFGRYGVLWWSPRAIELFPQANTAGRPCDACGEVHADHVEEASMGAIKARLASGTRHPRTAWLPARGEHGRALDVPPTGFTAESWLTLLLAEQVENALPAYAALTGSMRETAQLRCFGYSLDNSSPRVWLDEVTPIVLPESPEHRALMREKLLPLVQLIGKLADALGKALSNPKPNKVSSSNPIYPFVLSRNQARQTLWHQARPFLLAALKDTGPLTAETQEAVAQLGRGLVFKLFDQATAPLMTEPRFARLLINRKTKLIRAVSSK